MGSLASFPLLIIYHELDLELFTVLMANYHLEKIYFCCAERGRLLRPSQELDPGLTNTLPPLESFWGNTSWHPLALLSSASFIGPAKE